MRTAAALLLIASATITLVATRQSGADAAMAGAARAFMTTLDEAQRAKLVFPFDSDERQNWYFVPRARKGLPLKEMTAPQREAAFKLLQTGLSQKGFTKTEAIRSLEPVLRAMENNSPTRDLELYFFTIFGEPGSERWGWRYEGHHLSQNWTVVRGKAASTTPAFFGANPAEVREGPDKGKRALPAEGELGWKLLRALTPDQMKVAIIDPVAPKDILTSNTRKAAMLEHKGLDMQSMTAAQRALMMELIREYANNQSLELAQIRMTKVEREPMDAVVFAWMGGTDPVQGHYYRIQGRTFLIEYDNTQNNANHQHTVWRDFNGDFGADLLAAHYASFNHK